jgi:hypothetical protein
VICELLRFGVSINPLLNTGIRIKVKIQLSNPEKRKSIGEKLLNISK